MPQQLVTNCICNDGHKNEIQLDKRVTEPFPMNYLTVVSVGENSEADLLTSCRLLSYKFVPAPFIQISNFIS